MAKTTEQTLALAECLNRASDFMGEYVHFHSDAERHAVALWSAHTWTMDCWVRSPILHITSRRRGQGKTQIMQGLGYLCRNPEPVSAITKAALVSTIHEHGDTPPTMLIDEVDQQAGADIEAHSALVGILNGGYDRATATVRLMARGGGTAIKRTTWAPKALGGIGKLQHTTLASRSIEIRQRPKPADVEVREFIPHVARADVAEVVAGFEQWSATLTPEAVMELTAVCDLEGRDRDKWKPLIVISDLAGGSWAERARAAALTIVTGSVSSDPGLEALIDVARLLEQHGDMNGADLADRMCESPRWETYLGHRLTAIRLARLLNDFEDDGGHQLTAYNTGGAGKGRIWRLADVQPIALREAPAYRVTGLPGNQAGGKVVQFPDSHATNSVSNSVPHTAYSVKETA